MIGFGEQHAVRIILNPAARGSGWQDRVRLRQVFVVGAIALDQIGHGVQPQPVHAEVEPELHDAEHGVENARIVEVEIWLVAIKPMPEIGPADRIPGPVRLLGIDEDDARVQMALVGIRPHIKVASPGA